MDDFTYSIIRSFNQYVNNPSNFGTAIGEQLILNADPGHVDLDRDTVSIYFYDEVFRDYRGRSVGTAQGREVELYFQADVFSPPNNAGEPRQGACRKLKDKFEEIWKGNCRFPVLSWDGTGGTQVERYAYIRQQSAAPMPSEDMDGWSRWRLDYRITCIDTE